MWQVIQLIINNRIIPGVINNPTIQPGSSNQQIQKPSISFEDLLKKQVFDNTEVKFSKHAESRLETRNINLTDEQKSKLNEAINKANAKDVKDSFIKDVAGTALVETGKAAVIAMLTNKDFRTVATSRIDKAWKIKENNNDNNNNNNDNKNKNKGNNGAHTFTINMFNTSWDNAPKKDNKNK